MKEGAPQERPSRKNTLLKSMVLGAMMLGSGASREAKAQDIEAPTTPVESQFEPIYKDPSTAVYEVDSKADEIPDVKHEPLREMSPDLARDIEIWAQKDFYKTLDTLRYIAENNSVNGIMAKNEIGKLIEVNDEDIRSKLQSVGIEFDNLKIIPPQIVEKEDDSPEGTFHIGEYDQRSYLDSNPGVQAELDMGLYTSNQDELADAIIQNTFVYERWLKDKIRQFYQRYDSHRNITINTVFRLKSELSEIEKALSNDNALSNEMGVVLSVISKERTGTGFPPWGLKSIWNDKDVPRNETPKNAHIVIYPTDFGENYKIVLFPFVPEKIRDRVIENFGTSVHETDGLLVVDLGAGKIGYSITEWEDTVYDRLYDVGITSAEIFPLPWSDEGKEILKVSEGN